MKIQVTAEMDTNDEEDRQLVEELVELLKGFQHTLNHRGGR
jgi:hypothetical protein